jgi:hypothetical protein
MYKDLLKLDDGTRSKATESAEALEQASDQLRTKIISSFEKSCPLRKPRSNKDVPWWNKDIHSLRKTARKLFNRAKTTQDWDSYRRALTEYNKALRKAKRSTWRDFCGKVNDTPTVARLHKILEKDHSNGIGELKKPNGEFTQSEDETLQLLLETHFPGCMTTNEDDELQGVNRPRTQVRKLANKLFTQEKVEWAVKSFKPFKSPGGDGIYPIFLQKGLEILGKEMMEMFRASLIWGYIPQTWRDVRVAFIPKAGRRSGTEAKSFRPISLSSFLFKTMEKIIDHHIRYGLLIERPLSRSQFAYQSGKSTISALHLLASIIENTLRNGEIALSAFIDIEGAFNNTTHSSIQEALEHRGVDIYITKWIMSMLTNRRVTASLGNTHITVKTARGCPQGGCISPLLWSLVVDGLLNTLENNGHETIGFADDIVIISRGKHEEIIYDRLQDALHSAQTWCSHEGLHINPHKTTIVPFTRRRKLKLKAPMMEEVQIELS